MVVSTIRDNDFAATYFGIKLRERECVAPSDHVLASHVQGEHEWLMSMTRVDSSL